MRWWSMPDGFVRSAWEISCIISKVMSPRAVSPVMDMTNPTATAFRNLVLAADETLHLLCRLRGITINDLSEDALEAFFFNALDDEFWAEAR
jgi:hypothetical protein